MFETITTEKLLALQFPMGWVVSLSSTRWVQTKWTSRSVLRLSSHQIVWRWGTSCRGCHIPGTCFNLPRRVLHLSLFLHLLRNPSREKQVVCLVPNLQHENWILYLFAQFPKIKHISRARISDAYFVWANWIFQKFAHQNLAPGLASWSSAGDTL